MPIEAAQSALQPHARLALSRRTFVAAGAAVLTLGPTPSFATPDLVAAEIKKLYGEKPLQRGKIKFDLPSIAENGLVVPLGFEVDSPMTAADHVKTVHFFADGNPNPHVAAFHYTPLVPRAAAVVRIRLAKTQNIVAVAEMANGTLYTDQQEVKVTIGGCGG